MDLVRAVALGAASIAGTLTAPLLILYTVQVIVRVIRHWDTAEPRPVLRSWKLAGAELTLGRRTSLKTSDELKRLEEQVDRIERMTYRLMIRIVKLEGRATAQPLRHFR